jgi:hypothetical protein
MPGNGLGIASLRGAFQGATGAFEIAKTLVYATTRRLATTLVYGLYVAMLVVPFTIAAESFPPSLSPVSGQR